MTAKGACSIRYAALRTATFRLPLLPDWISFWCRLALAISGSLGRKARSCLSRGALAA
jgi:hypothetical protein